MMGKYTIGGDVGHHLLRNSLAFTCFPGRLILGGNAARLAGSDLEEEGLFGQRCRPRTLRRGGGSVSCGWQEQC